VRDHVTLRVVHDRVGHHGLDDRAALSDRGQAQ
jgi:hypothetical protein